MANLSRARRLALPILALLVLLATPAAGNAASTQTRYSLVHGCYSLSGANGRAVSGADRIRMQATALGHYLLYTPDGKFLAAQDDGSVSADAEPSPDGDWEVKPAGSGLFTLAPRSESGGRVLSAPASLAQPGSAGDAARIRFTRASGCAAYPEAPLDATGTPSKGSTSFGRVGGLVEGHMHWMTFEFLGGQFHCGRPWHPYGIRYALPDCSSIEGPQGTTASFQNTLNYGNPAQPHDTSGYPTLKEWSRNNLTYEGTYWRWVQRAWAGGLRMMVMGINENRVLCELQSNRQTNCNEMDTVRRGLKDVHDLQDYVDAQAGGPGKGFFQIVTNPYDARRVINQGKMAVLLEVEISEPFDCHGWEQPSCNQQQVDRELNELYSRGVRSMLLLNKFDNPLTGVRFDSGTTGYLINAGNKVSAGSYWSARTCTGKLHDNEIAQPNAQTGAALGSLLSQAGLTAGTAPSYPPAPHCNTRGLTDLGRHVVNKMMDKHMIVNPDHMSQAGVAETLSLLEARRYSGVISPHGWMDPGNWPRLWKLGGLAFPGHSSAASYVKDWKDFRPRQTPYDFGWGYGADMGGLSHQPDPSSQDSSFKYPFKSYDGKVTFTRQKTGSRTFDYGKEGVAQYGLYTDWFNDLDRLGGKQLGRDMWDGAEAYLEMWERADGIKTLRCHDSDEPINEFEEGPLRLGSNWKTLLRRAGQPQQRNRAWSWCVQGKQNAHRGDVAVLSQGGKVQLVGSTARGRSVAGVHLGTPLRRLRGTRSAGGGVRVRGRSVYVLKGGRVQGVALATRGLLSNPKALRAAARRLLAAKASNRTRKFVPSVAQANGTAPTGKPLAGTTNQKLNATLTMLCNLQLSGSRGATPGSAANFVR
jgi:microsomal dipeptidase-like Zn-dependent dipeptidase